MSNGAILYTYMITHSLAISEKRHYVFLCTTGVREACTALGITCLFATSYAKLPHLYTVVPSATFYIVALVPIYVPECHEKSTTCMRLHQGLHWSCEGPPYGIRREVVGKTVKSYDVLAICHSAPVQLLVALRLWLIILPVCT